MYICKKRTAYVHIKSADLDAGVGHVLYTHLDSKVKYTGNTKMEFC